MGHRVREGEAVSYWGVWYNKICQTSNEPRDGYRQRIVKNTKGESVMKYVREADLIGYIDSVVYQAKELKKANGEPFTIHEVKIRLISDEGEVDVLGLDLDKEGGEFLKKIPGIDFSKQYVIEVGGAIGKRGSIFVKELFTSEKVLHTYKKETPYDMPPVIVTPGLNNKLDYNFAPQLNWLTDKLKNDWAPIIEQYSKLRNITPVAPTPAPGVPTAVVPTGVDPFAVKAASAMAPPVMAAPVIAAPMMSAPVTNAAAAQAIAQANPGLFPESGSLPVANIVTMVMGPNGVMAPEGEMPF